MAGIPSKCPKCRAAKAWKEEVNPFTSGIPTPFGRVRSGIVIKGLLARPIERAMGFYKVTYRCHKCGFRKEYSIDEWE